MKFFVKFILAITVPLWIIPVMLWMFADVTYDYFTDKNK